MPDDNRKLDEDEVLVPPANVGGTPFGPEASDSPPHPTEPHPPTDEASPELLAEIERAEKNETPDPAPEPLPEFDPRWIEPFEGLMFIGKLTDEFHYLGHTFVIRTLVTDEVLEVGLLTKEFIGTLAESKAYQSAVTAACIVSVDGRPPPIPITNEAEDTMLVNRFRWVRDKFFPPVIDAIYERYLLLESTVAQVMEALGKASG